ncbi:MAG: hypothetical protein ACXWXO_20150 [Nocardioides sp.]
MASLSALRPPLLALLLALVLALGLAPWVPTAAAPPGATSIAAQADDQRLLVGSYNIRADRNLRTFRKAVNAIQRQVEVVGIQEVGGPAARRKSRSLAREKSWGYYRPPKLGQNPVIWRRSTFERVHARGHLLAKGRRIGNENPGTDRRRKTAYATVVRLRHRATNQRISVINVHLVAGAVKAAKKWPGRPRLYEMYVEEVRHLGEVARAEQDWGRGLVTGDFNVGFAADLERHHRRLPYATFKRIGMVSMWAGRTDQEGGTRQYGLVDQVWSTNRAVAGRVARGIRYSDHFPAIAAYRLDVAP